MKVRSGRVTLPVELLQQLEDGALYSCKQQQIVLIDNYHSCSYINWAYHRAGFVGGQTVVPCYSRIMVWSRLVECLYGRYIETVYNYQQDQYQ
jgi:hypothetical protein